MEGYYCVKAIFSNSSLTMSVNVPHDLLINTVYRKAFYYFKEKSKNYVCIKKLILYYSETDMHSDKNVMGVLLVDDYFINNC